MVDALGSILTELKGDVTRIAKSSTKIEVKGIDSDDDTMSNVTGERRQKSSFKDKRTLDYGKVEDEMRASVHSAAEVNRFITQATNHA